MSEFYLALKLMTEPRHTWPTPEPAPVVQVAKPVEVMPPSAELRQAIERFKPGKLVAVRLADGRVLYVPEGK